MPAPGDSGAPHFVGSRLTVDKAEIGNLQNPAASNIVVTDADQLITGVKSGPLQDYGGIVYSVKAAQAGATGTAQQVGDGVMNGTTGVLTSASNKFVAGDVGKAINVYGAGAAGATLTTTIASYQSAGQVTLTASSSTAVAAATVQWGIDDKAAFQAAIDATAGADATILLPPGTYLIQSAITIHAVRFLSTGGTVIGIGASSLNRWRNAVINVKDFNAKGDSVTDDTVALKAAVAASQISSALPVHFPPGNYIVKSYIDVTSGFVWKGGGWQATGATGTTITCKGGVAGQGILRFRPGTIGVEDPNSGAEGYVEGIAFVGDAATATTGHLVSLARVNNVRFHYCAFSDTRGSGLKDDQVTSIAAHGVYMFGCEQISFEVCQWANNLNASGGGVGYENACHGHWYGGCHWTNNTFGVHIVGAGTGVNGGFYFDGCFFIAQVATFRVETAGNANNVSCFGCWTEGAVTADGGGCWIDGVGVNRLFNWTAVSCVLKGKATGLARLTANVILDSCSWISCFFDTYGTVFQHTSTNGGNVLIAPNGNAVTNYFNGGDPANQGFSFVTGLMTNPANANITQNVVAVYQKRVTLTDGANVAINLALGNDFFLAAAGSRTINAWTSTPGIGYAETFSVTISNTTGGAITTTWNGAYHLAGAWVDPAAGKQRTITFRLDGSIGLAYELSRTAADVTP